MRMHADGTGITMHVTDCHGAQVILQNGVVSAKVASGGNDNIGLTQAGEAATFPAWKTLSRPHISRTARVLSTPPPHLMFPLRKKENTR
jgi:hypothetical protein